MTTIRERRKHSRQPAIPRIEYSVPVSALVCRSGEPDFRPGPINPEWVIAGNPQARSAALVASADGGGATNFWDCTAGKFNWHYVWDETVLILAGNVQITDAGGATSLLSAGDVAHFQAGHSYLWEVDRYVRKLAFHRRPEKSVLRRLLGIVARRIHLH